jgi:hypothetical protein
VTQPLIIGAFHKLVSAVQASVGNGGPAVLQCEQVASQWQNTIKQASFLFNVTPPSTLRLPRSTRDVGVVGCCQMYLRREPMRLLAAKPTGHLSFLSKPPFVSLLEFPGPLCSLLLLRVHACACHCS